MIALLLTLAVTIAEERSPLEVITGQRAPLVTSAGELLGLTAQRAANERDAAQCQPTPGATRWAEDCLPMRLQRYTDHHGADLTPIGTIHGHPHCWAAIADTTLVMCPDGFTTAS